MNAPNNQAATSYTFQAGKRMFFLAFVASLVGLIIKTPGAINHAQFWAEDGVVFFASQFDHAWPQLLTPYAGYLHAIPRLVAWLASFFPYAQAPFIYNTLAMLLDAWAIAYFAARINFIAPSWVCVAIILFAPSNGEMLGTLTNVQWFLQFVVFAMSMLPSNGIQRPRTTFHLATLFTLFAISLTGPFSALCLIMLAGLAMIYSLSLGFKLPTGAPLENWWRRCDRPAVSLTAIGGAIQLCVLLTVGQRTNSGHFSFKVAKKLFSEGIERHTLGFAPIPPVMFFSLFIALIFFRLSSHLQAARQMAVYPFHVGVCIVADPSRLLPRQRRHRQCRQLDGRSLFLLHENRSLHRNSSPAHGTSSNKTAQAVCRPSHVTFCVNCYAPRPWSTTCTS